MTKKTFTALIPIILWSTAFAGVKIGLAYAAPLFFAGLRFMISGLLVLIYLRDVRGFFDHTRTHWRTIIQTAILQTGLFYALYYLGIDRVPASVAAVVMGSGPLYTALMAHLFLKQDKLTIRKMITIITSLLGIILLAADRDPGTFAGRREIFGIILLSTGCISESLAQTLIKRSNCDPLPLNAAQIFLGGLMLTTLSLFTEGSHRLIGLPAPFWFSLVWLSFVSAAAFSIWYTLLRDPEVRLSELNLLKFLNPILGALISWAILSSDTPNLSTILGMVIISLSVFSYHRSAVRPIPPAEPSK